MEIYFYEINQTKNLKSNLIGYTPFKNIFITHDHFDLQNLFILTSRLFCQSNFILFLYAYSFLLLVYLYFLPIHCKAFSLHESLKCYVNLLFCYQNLSWIQKLIRLFTKNLQNQELFLYLLGLLFFFLLLLKYHLLLKKYIKQKDLLIIEMQILLR